MYCKLQFIYCFKALELSKGVPIQIRLNKMRERGGMFIRLVVVTAGCGSSSGRRSSKWNSSSNSSSGVVPAVAAAAALSSSSSSRSSGSGSSSSRSRGRHRSSCSRRGRHRRRHLSSLPLAIVVDAEAAVTEQHLMHIACPCCRHVQEPVAIAAPQGVASL